MSAAAVSPSGVVAAERVSGGLVWRELVALLRPRWSLLAVVAGLVLASAGLELLPPLIIQRLIDGHLKVGDASGLWQLALTYLAAVGGAQVIAFLHGYLTAVVAQFSLNDLRVGLLRHLQRLPLAYFDRTSTGDLISRATADVETINTLFSSGVAVLLVDLVRLVTVVGAMVALSPFLSLVSLVAVPVVTLVTRYFRTQVVQAERLTRLAVGGMNAELQETLSGAEVIRAFGREAGFVERFFGSLRGYLAAANRAAAYNATYGPIMNVTAALATALLLWVGVAGAGLFGSSAQVSVGTLAAFVLLFRRFFAPISALGDEWQTVQQAVAGAERVFGVLGVPVEDRPRLREPADAFVSTARLDGHEVLLGVRGLRFGYAEGVEVLRGITLRVRRGEHVAIVGRTGAGKSSLLQLLAGQYAPWSGEVRVAGVDPRGVPAEARRRLFGVVPQAVQLFEGTVRENITLGDESLGPDAVERAARLAGAHDFILALPRGYDTPLGAGGISLSAGQRQLLALARALVWDAPVLLLDEATSAIDAATEQAIRRALRAVGHDRAIVTIAHRLATAREADRVLVLAGGRVVEEGTPEELLASGGRFAAMVELEESGWHWEELADER